jgi:hypothetical protein
MEEWNGDGETVCDTCGWPELTPSEIVGILQENVDEVYRQMGVVNTGRRKCRARLDNKRISCIRVQISKDVSEAGKSPEFLRRLYKRCGEVWSMNLNVAGSYVNVHF